jgi:hypothetical protein
MKIRRWSNRNRFTSIVRFACAGTLIAAGVITMLTLLLGGTMTTSVGAASAQSAGFYVGHAALSGTSSPQSGNFTPSGDSDVTRAEWPGQIDEPDGSPGPFPGSPVNRSLSKGSAKGVSVSSGKKAKSNPQLKVSFSGLNHYQQRYSRGGNQFSVEPPDQGMCVGNGYVVEVVNDVFNVFSPTTGASLLPDNTATNVVSGFPRNVNHAIDLNSFFGYPPAINRSTGVRGQFVTDPSCLYDAATQRFFLIALTLENYPASFPNIVNHLDIAVSQTSDPTGGWNIYHVDVTNDGTNAGGVNPCPCLGDYPHIGADANGFYVTTNSYPWATNGFDGAQIYAFSKAQLAAGAASVNMVHIDTFGLVNAPSDAGSTQPGFTVWAAQSPPNQFNASAGGTEYFLSSNAADEAQKPVSGSAGTRSSTQIVAWTLTNTSSLNTSPALSLSNNLITVNQYGVPPKQVQPGSGTTADKATTPDVAQGDCLNDETTLLFDGTTTGCWNLLVGTTAHAAGSEVIASPDSNDTRMQQVMYANGKLWGALDTAVSFDNIPANDRAGIAWYILNPTNSKLAMQGTYGITGASLTYPAIGVTAAGRGVMAFSYTDATTNPSAAYAPIDASVGLGDTHIIATSGATRDDGFSGYKQQNFPNPIRSRWGDFGAAAVDGNSVWIASELTQTDPCNYTDWGGPFFFGGSGDNLLGTCGGASHGPGTRTALADWNTRISKLTP